MKTQVRARVRSGRRAELARGQPKKLGETEKWVWVYCKPLKFPKTAKTFFGNPWRRNRTSLEILGIGTAIHLEGFGEGVALGPCRLRCDAPSRRAQNWRLQRAESPSPRRRR